MSSSCSASYLRLYAYNCVHMQHVMVHQISTVCTKPSVTLGVLKTAMSTETVLHSDNAL